jgi:hypothetical protein
MEITFTWFCLISPEVKWDFDIFKWILIEIEIRMDFCYS